MTNRGRRKAAPFSFRFRLRYIGAVRPLVAAALCLPVAGLGATSLVLAPTQPEQSSSFAMKMERSHPGSAAHSDPALLGRTDSTPVQVLVKLDYDPVMNYQGDVPGLAATSPEKTGVKLAQNQAAVNAYNRYAAIYEAKVLDRVRHRIPEASVRESFRTIYGGVAMTLPANRIADLLSIDGVVAVQRDSLERPVSDRGTGPPR